MEQALYLHALDLFNRAAFFDAHEVWEDVWRAAPPEEKKFLQGLIQVAVAFHHHSTGNLVGARSLLERGTRNLQGYPEEHGDLRLAVFLHSLAAWKRALADGRPLPPLPHIERCEGSGTRLLQSDFPVTAPSKPHTLGAKPLAAVPLLDLQRQYEQIRAEVLAAVGRVCASQQYILGSEVESFEHDLADFCGAKEAVGCASGTDALWLALVAAGVQPGDQVLTTPLANEFHLAMVEDAAQAIGAAWRDRRAGSAGVAAAFSFYPTKNLSAYGEAGLVTTNDPELAAHMRRLRNHGSSRRYVHEELGWNSRLDAMQAAILHVKLKYLEGWNQARRQRAVVYDKLFAEAGLTAGRRSQSHAARPRSESASVSHSTINHPPSTISASSPVQLPQTSSNALHIFHQYVIRPNSRTTSSAGWLPVLRSSTAKLE